MPVHVPGTVLEGRDAERKRDNSGLKGYTS